MAIVNYISKWHLARLKKMGFTASVNGVQVTGGSDGVMARVLPGGRRKVSRLKKLNLR